MKKILIIYEDMGGGHRRAAQILAQAIEEIPGHEVQLAVGSEFFESPGGARAVTWLWNFFLERDLLRINDLLLNFFLRTAHLPLGDALESRRAYRILERCAPDAIISTADMFNKALGTYAEHEGIPFSIVITDLSVFMDLVHPHATHVCIFDETAGAVRSFPFDSPYFSTRLAPWSSARERITYVWKMYAGYVASRRWGGIFRNIDGPHARRNEARCTTVGPLLLEQHFEPVDACAARRIHGIDEGVPCVLLLSGSLGSTSLETVTRELLARWRGRLTVLAVCGRADGVRARIEAHARSGVNPEVRVVPLGFVDRMSELYAAADAVIARPSAGVVTEALLSRTPPVLPAHAMSNDLGCVELVRRRGLGEVYDGPDDLVRSLRAVIRDPQRYRGAMDDLLARSPRSFDELKRRLLDAVLPGAAATSSRGAGALLQRVS